LNYTVFDQLIRLRIKFRHGHRIATSLAWLRQLKDKRERTDLVGAAPAISDGVEAFAFTFG
jgi:hypothetical protein